MGYLFPLIIPLINFFLQSYPRFINKLFGVDVWTRLIETDHLRKNNHKVPNHKLADQFIIGGYFDYPPVFPLLLSYIPKKQLLILQGFIAPFFDSIQVVLIYFVGFYLSGNIYFALLAQIMYMLTPMIAIENSYLTPRSLGYLNFSLATLPLLLFILNGSIWFFLVGIFFVTFLFLTHRFAIQSFLFLTIFFTFYLNTAVFMQSFLIGFGLAILITRGYYIRVLKGHLYNIYFWINNLDYRFAHQIRGNIKKTSQTDWVGNIYKFLSAFSPIAVFGLNPWALSGFLILIANYLGWLNTSLLLQMFAAWIIFFYFFGVLVLKVKSLMPIGEGQRYMEMATVPSAILSAYLFFELLKTPYQIWTVLILAIILLVNLSLILFIQLKGVIKDRNRSITTDLVKVFRYINKQKHSLRIICIPHQNTTMTVYHTKAAVFVNADNPGLMRIQGVYPVLKIPIKTLVKKYKLTHALIKESFATKKELKLINKKTVFESGDVKLVSFN